MNSRTINVFRNINYLPVIAALTAVSCAGCAAGVTEQKPIMPMRSTPVVPQQRVEAIEQILTNNPNDMAAQKKLAAAYITNNNYEQARHVADTLLHNHPADVDANYLMALILTRQGFDDEALKYYNKTLELDPVHVPSLFATAYLAEKKGNFYQARKLYHQVLENSPHDPDAHYNLAVLYDKKLFDEKKALYHYEKALHLYRNTEASNELLAIIKERISELKLLQKES